MLIDTHCHLYKEYYNYIDKVIEEAIENNVKIMIVNGVDRQSNEEVIKLVNNYPNLYGTLGYHPSEANTVSVDDLKFLENNLNNLKIVGLGEIGLDYYWENKNKQQQQELFHYQLKLATKYQKPVIIHTREAINDVYEILKQYNLRGIVHCYSGSVEMAKKFTDMGFLLGIGGIVTFKNAPNIIKVVREINLEKLVIETDAPYITPEPYRGQQNTPAHIPYIIEKIAELKSIDCKEVEDQIEHNTRSLFDFYFEI